MQDYSRIQTDVNRVSEERFSLVDFDIFLVGSLARKNTSYFAPNPWQNLKASREKAKKCCGSEDSNHGSTTENHISCELFLSLQTSS